MALVEIPFVGITLLEHVSGGAILSGSQGYIAGSFVGADTLQAFGVAASTLKALGGAAVAGTSLPAVAAGAACVGVVAAATYCYFHGLPVPVAEALAKAGLGTWSKVGLATAPKAAFAIAVPKLAVALVLLGSAGFITYRIYRSEADLAADPAVGALTIDDARAVSEAAFGANLWSSMGDALWAGTSHMFDGIPAIATKAVAATTSAFGLAWAAAEGAGRDAAAQTAPFLARLAATLGGLTKRLRR